MVATSAVGVLRAYRVATDPSQPTKQAQFDVTSLCRTPVHQMGARPRHRSPNVFRGRHRGVV